MFELVKPVSWNVFALIDVSGLQFVPSVDFSTAYVVIENPLFVGTVQSNCIVLPGNAVSVKTGASGTSPAFDDAVAETSPVPTTLIADTRYS